MMKAAGEKRTDNAKADMLPYERQLRDRGKNTVNYGGDLRQ